MSIYSEDYELVFEELKKDQGETELTDEEISEQARRVAEMNKHERQVANLVGSDLYVPVYREITARIDEKSKELASVPDYNNLSQDTGYRDAFLKGYINALSDLQNQFVHTYEEYTSREKEE